MSKTAKNSRVVNRAAPAAAAGQTSQSNNRSYGVIESPNSGKTQQQYSKMTVKQLKGTALYKDLDKKHIYKTKANLIRALTQKATLSEQHRRKGTMAVLPRKTQKDNKIATDQSRARSSTDVIGSIVCGVVA